MVGGRVLYLLLILEQGGCLYVAPLWIQLIHELHGLFVHGEDDAATEDKSTQSWKRSRPEGEETLIPENLGRTVEAVLVGAPCLY